MSSKKATVAFADKILQHFPPFKWDEEKEAAWAETLVKELSGFPAEVINRAAREMVRTRKKDKTPLVSECIEACDEARRWMEAEKGAQNLPSLANTCGPQNRDSIERAKLVDDLLKTNLAKQAAREGWIGMLEPYLYQHGEMPRDTSEISRMKRTAQEIDNWHSDGSAVGGLIAQAKIDIMEKRERLIRKVLGDKS